MNHYFHNCGPCDWGVHQRCETEVRDMRPADVVCYCGDHLPHHQRRNGLCAAAPVLTEEGGCTQKAVTVASGLGYYDADGWHYLAHEVECCQMHADVYEALGKEHIARLVARALDHPVDVISEVVTKRRRKRRRR